MARDTARDRKSTILGREAERRARKKYGLEADRNEWRDARYSNGTPVEVKACKPQYRFRLFREAHHKLASQKGWYVFVVYTPVTVGESPADTKIQVHGMKRRKATTVTRIVRDEYDGWDESGHEKGKQQKLPPKAVL